MRSRHNGRHGRRGHAVSCQPPWTLHPPSMRASARACGVAVRSAADVRMTTWRCCCCCCCFCVQAALRRLRARRARMRRHNRQRPTRLPQVGLQAATAGLAACQRWPCPHGSAATHLCVHLRRHSPGGCDQRRAHIRREDGQMGEGDACGRAALATSSARSGGRRQHGGDPGV